MMGGSHALTGVAAWIAITSTAPAALGLAPLGTDGVLLGSLVTAGAALVADADHHNATIAHSLPDLGPIKSPTRLLAEGVGKIAGGHRHGTHSVVGIVAFTAIAAAANLVIIPNEQFGSINVGGGLLALLLIAFAMKALKLSRGGWMTTWGYAIVGAAAVTLYAPDTWGWLPLAMCVGVCVHIAGDMLTVGGCPIFYPWYPKHPKWLTGLINHRLPRAGGLKGFLVWMAKSAPAWFVRVTLARMWQPNGFFAVPILGKTGSVRELFFAAVPVTGYCLWGIAWTFSNALGVDLGATLAELKLLQ